jgi:hypothetical protein
MAGLALGARCIRGPDWKWEDQDGGPGKADQFFLPSVWL